MVEKKFFTEVVLLTKSYNLQDFKDWMHWHLDIIGFQRCHVFDNESSVDIKSECQKYGNRVTLDILDGIKTLLNTGTAMEAIAHKMTHYFQEKCGEIPNAEEEVAKYGINPEEYDPHLHHEFLPWEIDADVQGHIISFIRMNCLLSPNEMAKKIYDMFIHSKRNEGRIPEELRKQCWQTAASLARAVNLATERDGYDGAEEIIKHLDDYGV